MEKEKVRKFEIWRPQFLAGFRWLPWQGLGGCPTIVMHKNIT